MQTIDKYSGANIHAIQSLHYDLDLAIDFSTSTLRGKITHHFKAVSTGNLVVLDARDLAIKRVYLAATGKELAWQIYSYDYITDTKNDQLAIWLDSALNYGQFLDLTIEYETSPDATAANWVPANQTFGGQYKFMYTQCEAIHCRSLAPLQDSPAIKSTFNATLRVPKPYRAIASAVLVDEREENGTNVFRYAQRIPVQSYLLAMVAGYIDYQRSGPRASVYAEPKILNQSAWELQEMDLFLDTIEHLLTPYQWGTYSVVIMPPSFPYGGMENPYLTFVSPSIILGDRSSTYVVAHEICHSWFGNLITNRNWTHFWLNEGFTQYATRLILRKVYGESKYTCQARIGVNTLRDEVAEYLAQNKPACTTLFPNVYRDGPDDIMSDVPYEKGFLLVTHLENLMGSLNFYDFLRAYLSSFAYRSIDSWDLKATLESYLHAYLPNNASEILRQVDWTQWMFEPGMPKQGKLEFINPEIESSLRLADYYVDHKQGPENKTIYKSFMLDLRVIFVQQLQNRDKELTAETLRAIDKDFDITAKETNPEVLFTWLRLLVANKCDEATPRAKSFLGTYGRMKYVVPIYTAYASANRAEGLKIYQELRYKYHPIAQAIVDKVFAG